MVLETERLLLRPWEDRDAASLFEYAKDERIGPIAGWAPHKNVKDSLDVIRNILSKPETYAVCLKENTRKPIGCIGLTVGNRSHMNLSDTEGEIGYWIGVPFWGQGLIPEAMEAILHHAFEDLHLEAVWCGYFNGNQKSNRVLEKCGFTYHHTNKDIHWKAMNDIRTEHISRLRRTDWKRRSCSS